jgi:hypothetical protein
VVVRARDVDEQIDPVEESLQALRPDQVADVDLGPAALERRDRTLPPGPYEESQLVSRVRETSGEIRQLVDLLSRLEGSQKLLTVQDLRVRVVNVSQPKELLATLTVSGFILPGKSKT